MWINPKETDIVNIFFIFYFTLPEAFVFLSALNLSSLPWLTDIRKFKTVGLQHVCSPKGNCCLVFSCDLFGKFMNLVSVSKVLLAFLFLNSLIMLNTSCWQLGKKKIGLVIFFFVPTEHSVLLELLGCIEAAISFPMLITKLLNFSAIIWGSEIVL